MHPDEAKLVSVAREVAKHLDGEWTPDPEYPRALTGPRGLRLLFSRMQPRPRGSVHGLLPDGANRLHLRSEDRAKSSIGVDLARHPAAIAREIERRLLPQFEPLLAEVIARLAEQRAFTSGRAALLGRLSPLAPQGVRVEASSDAEVKVTLYLSEAEARAVFAALEVVRGRSEA